MAEQLGSVVLQVGVDDRPLKAGLANARREADNAGKGIKASLGGALSAIGQAAAAAGIGAVALQIGRIGIEADSAQTRLAALTGRFNETAEAQAIVGAAAKTLNLTQTEAASGFSQLYASLRPTGVSLAQIETIFVGVTAAAKNTGLSAGSVSAALTQLTQGLASGRLQGDELRSVMEQLPPLSQAIAKTMGVSVGEIKKLGSEGKITTEIIIKALEGLKAQELGQLDKTLNSTAEQMKRLQVETEKLQVSIFKAFSPALLSNIKAITAALGAANAAAGAIDRTVAGRGGPKGLTGILGDLAFGGPQLKIITGWLDGLAGSLDKVAAKSGAANGVKPFRFGTSDAESTALNASFAAYTKRQQEAQTAMEKGAKAIAEASQKLRDDAITAAGALKDAIRGRDSNRVSNFDILTDSARADLRNSLNSRINASITAQGIDPARAAAQFGAGFSRAGSFSLNGRTIGFGGGGLDTSNLSVSQLQEFANATESVADSNRALIDAQVKNAEATRALETAIRKGAYVAVSLPEGSTADSNLPVRYQ